MAQALKNYFGALCVKVIVFLLASEGVLEVLVDASMLAPKRIHVFAFSLRWNAVHKALAED